MENEKRLIEYDAVYKYAFDGVHGGCLEDEDFSAIINAIDAVPTVDAVEVVHGRWIQHWGHVECSKCRNRFSYLGGTNYCPNCGAKMDGGE